MTAPADPEALPLDAVLAVDPVVLAGSLLAVPDGENALLRLADGRRTVGDVIASSGMDGSLARASLVRLLDAGVLRVVPPGTLPAPAEPGGPEGADWFADPESAPHPGGEPGPAHVLAPPAPFAGAPAPAGGRTGPSRTRGRVVAAALLLGTALLGAALWARSPREPSPPPSQALRPASEPTPPALSVTEAGPSPDYREAMAAVAARYKAGDLSGAAEACRRAIAVDPSIGAGWMALGEVTLAAGDRAGAREAFQRYLAAEPDGRHASRARTLLERLRP